MARNSMFGMAGIGIAAAIGFVLVLSSVSNFPQDPAGDLGPGIFRNGTGTPPTPLALVASQDLKKFSSTGELKAFLLNLEQNREQLAGSLGSLSDDFRLAITDDELGSGAASPESPQVGTDTIDGELSVTTTVPAPSLLKGSSYSTTNVQVEGVDEPDFLKNDGKYVYILSGDKLTIVNAFPAEDSDIAVKIALDIQEGQYLQNMFLNNDTLVIFYQEYKEDFVIQEYDYAPRPFPSPQTHALVMDVSDTKVPKIVRDFEVTGNYNNARMIGNNVYLITTSELYDYRQPIVPKIAESSRTVVFPDIYYFDNPELYYAFNTVTSIDLAADDEEEAIESKTFMMNPAATLYVSEENIYIAYQKNLPYPYYYETHSRERFFEAVVPLLPEDVQQQIKEIDDDRSLTPAEKWDRVSELLQDTYNRMSEADKNELFAKIQESLQEYDAKIQKESLKTIIHKIEIDSNGLINYSSKGEIPGRLLNQFSMDEHGGRFRVATTSEFWTPHGGSVLHNNVYVLDEGMKIVGSLEEIAKNESIFAARFMGDKLYLVTFERTDPFFVIDLSSDDPKILGELKLPGFSNYLHPYDEDHVIGVGREAKENQYGGIEILGVKLALFDVSDVSNPKVVDMFEIEGTTSDSEVLYDHKALLFDRNKDVLSIPVSIGPDYSVQDPAREGTYVEPKIWRGFYVFGVDPESGFRLKGTVEHFNDVNDYYYIYGVQGSRSFYIDDVLYTVTLNNLIKMNDLESLKEINELEIGTTGGIIPYPEPAEGGGSTGAPPSK